MFKNAFDESYFNNNLRPTSDDWCRALSPDPVIQINRKLPTKTISCFTPIYTQDIQLKLLPEFVVKKPLFLSEAKASVFSKFFKSFKKNEKDKVFKQILVLQLKVDGLIKEIERIRSNLLFERKKIENQKTDILKEEKEIIDKHIKILFHPKAHVVDLKALNLINLEKDRRIAYQKKYKKEFNALELEIKELYEIHVNGFDSINNKKLDELKSSLSDCINLENNQIKKLDLELKIKLDLIRADIQKFEKDFYDKAESDGKLKLQAIETKKNKLKNKEKKLIDSALEKYQSSYSNNNLSQYKIYDDRYNIFTDSYADPDKIIKNLASHGITTAADIKGVDESGRILKSDGSWIKVPEVAKTRAKRLNEWRHKNERIHTSTPPPQSLPYTEELLVKQSLATELQSIEEEEKKIRQDVLNQKRGITYTLNQKLNEAKKIEQNEIQIIQTKKANIMQMFKIEKDTIQQRISSHLHSYDESKKGQIKIFEQMSSKLRSKIDRLESQKDDFDKKISEEFDQPHIQLITELKQLDNQFKDELNKLNIQKISELKIVKSSYENKHKKFMQELKDAADELNSTCSTLVTIQKQYSTMK